VVTEIEFSASSDAGQRLRKVFELLLAKSADAEGPNNNSLKGNRTKKKEDVDMDQQQ